MTNHLIRTPDQRLRVFVSSTLQELADERGAARQAIEQLRLAPVMFELGARPHPPKDLYRAYLDQSHVFIGVYWQKYGWVAPDMDVSGLEDEYLRSYDKPKLIYLKSPAPQREARLDNLLDRIRNDDRVSYKTFRTLDELRELIISDLAMVLSESFETTLADAANPIEAAATDRPAPRHNLPLPPTRLIGRAAELAAAIDLIRRDDTGLVTLTGAGGTGKTRLALQVALELVDDFEDGVTFVPLAPIGDPALVLAAIAQVLGVTESASRPLIELLIDRLHNKHQLLVLDNFEQVVDAAPHIAELLRACPRLQVLATSRTPLRVRGEKELPVPPLELPPRSASSTTGETLSQYAAVELFIQRARDVKPDFAVTNATAPALAEICYRLDGLPLAIELAASRIKLLSPQALLNRLQHRLEMLTGGARDLPLRQQTLRNTIDWSYDLLDDDAKVLFRRLSVFVGGWTYDTAEAVTNADGQLGIDLYDELDSLVNNSLTQSRELDGELRFSMLETIREYAHDKLHEASETERIHRAHAAACLTLVEQAEPELMRPSQAAWLDRLELEYGNIRAALDWCKTHDLERGLRIAGALYRFWELHSHIIEGRTWLETLATLSTGVTLSRAKVLNAAGAMADYMGDYASAQAYFEVSLAIFETHGDRRRTAAALNNLAMAVSFQMQFDRARDWLEQAQAIKRELGDTWSIANGLDNLGRIALFQSDYEMARQYAAEAVAMFRTLGDRTGVAISQGNVADALLHLGRLAESRAAMVDSLTLLRTIGEKDGIADGLERFASLATVEHRWLRAATLFGAAAVLRKSIGTAPAPPDKAEYDARLSKIRSALVATEFESAWRVGEALKLDEAVELALSAVD
ncbi:MAG: tetratricopeptide repeat protein [Chloroflexi bacterium]|nr:tetratricopeptide repeat protein [Chloroflexota bacterium]